MNAPISTNMMTDDELVLAAIDGDQAAWTLLVPRIDSRLLPYLCGRGSREDAEEAKQTAWTKMVARIKSFDPRDAPAANFRGYIFRIAHNDLVSIQRRNRGQALPEGFDVEDVDAADVDDGVDKQLLRMIHSCIEELPERFRSVFLMRVSDSTQAIASQLAIAAGTVHSRNSRAKQMLRECIENKQRSEEY